MPRRNNISKILIIGAGPIVVLGLCIAHMAQACTVFGIPFVAAANFDLIVQDDGRPVAGIPIVVTRVGDKTNKPLLELKSDQDGRVPIRGLLPGEYAIDNLGPLKADEMLAVVKKHGPEKLAKPVVFPWPLYGIVNFKSLQGTLRAASAQYPFAAVDVAVMTVDTGTQLKALRTGADGHFKFSEMPPGLYVVQVHGSQPGIGKNWEVNGPIAVRIVPDSPSAADNVELILGESSCGIWYAHCPPKNSIDLASRRIQVTDPLGAVVGSAQYAVEDTSGKKVAEGHSDQEGVIVLPAELIGGAYKLRVSRLGFTPLEQPLEFVPPLAGAKTLNVVLNVDGVCSQASLEKHATP
ncbi:MAG TPA: hypothetical protein VGK24_02195 [Candidatus Angelobacter sp.]|jgi:hypothetical protein